MGYNGENGREESVMRQEITCCFTGHRPSKLPWGEREEDGRCLALKERLRLEVERAYEDGYRHFICGMARGADLYFCEAVLRLREERPGVTVEAALPCAGQSARWPEASRTRHAALVDRCDIETVVQHTYDRGCMQRRDRYMVDRSHRIIAVFNGQSGGTQYTLGYAMGRGLEVRILDLNEFE